MTKKASKPGEELPKFLVDSPAKSDEFGAHGRLASVIAEIIRGDERIKTIGLIGSWGSGKSSVAKMVEDKLTASENQPSIFSFTYDAWLHQSDPQRRAFLESLLAYLDHTTGFEDIKRHQKEWRKELKQLDGDERKTNTTVTPTLTGPGRWYIFTIPLVPIGFKLMGDTTIAFRGKFDLIAFLGWLLAFSPVLAAAWIYVWWRPKGSIFTRRFWATHRTPYDKESILSVIANKHVEVRDEITQGNSEPTAIEFQDTFREIMSKAQTASRRLIIVVDNLDRLPPADAQRFWATVRSFFLGADGGAVRLPRKSLPTVLVPIDEKAFSRMYDDSLIEGDDESIFSASFIEKTFDLVFNVPAPVLSKWHKYLRDRLTDVFGPRIPENWIHDVGTVYESWLSNKRVAATPRSINSFVNGIATLWMQFKSENIHIGVIAYYILHEDELSKNIHSAVASPNTMLDNFEAEWRLSIAALHFGVSREEAKEIFMVGPIRVAIATKDSDEFRRLSAILGFDRYLLRVLDTSVSDANAPSAMHAASLLSSLPQQAPWISEAWRKIRGLAITWLRVKPYRLPDVAGLSAILASCDRPERILFEKAIAKGLEGLGADVAKPQSAPAFAEAAALIIDQAVKDGLDDFGISVPGGASEFVSILLQGLAPSITKRLAPKGGVQAVLNYLTERFADVTAAYAVRGAAVALADRGGSNLDWAAFIDAMSPALRANDTIRIGQASAVLKDLYSRIDLARDKVASFRADGSLAAAFNSAWDANAETEIADVAALLMADGGAAQIPNADWATKLSITPELPRLLLEALRDLGTSVTIDWLVSRSVTYPIERPLLEAMATRLLSEGASTGRRPEEVFQDLEAYINLLPPESAPEFWGNLSRTEGFWHAQESVSNARVAPVLRSVIRSSVNKVQLGKALQKRFHNTPAEEWGAALREGAEPLGLVESLDQLERSTVAVGANANAELRSLMDELLTDSDEVFRARWFRVASRLSEPTRKTLFKILRDRLVSGISVSEPQSLLRIGGNSLLIEGEFAKKPEPVALHLMLPLLQTDEGRKWLLENVSETLVWFRKSKRQTRTSLVEQLGRLRDQGHVGADELLKAFA